MKILNILFRHLQISMNLILGSMCFSFGFAQNQNINLIANLNDYSAIGYTDCWGYTAANGDEYALLGVYNGVSIINVTDTTNVTEVEFIPWVTAPPYGWYDIKTYSEFMYVSSEGSQDIMIVDLGLLPNSTQVAGYLTGLTSGPHNIYIDTSAALLYAVEDLQVYPSVRIFSLADPVNPVEVSTINGKDAHDIFAQDSVLYVAEGMDPSIGIYDMSDPTNPSLLTRLTIPSPGYVHQVWVTEDNQYMITTEETAGKTIKFWDIQDLNNISLISEYLGSSQLAHNAYFSGNSIYIAHYESGLKVVDFSDPYNIAEAGFYDTYPQSDLPEFNGAWGVYPFVQNGLIYASDMTTGLYVLRFKQELGPQIAALPAIHDFGNIEVGSYSDTLIITMRNFGTTNLTINNISDPGMSYSLSEIPSLPVIILPNEFETFKVNFSPFVAGIADTVIAISSNDVNDPVYFVQLKGNGFEINSAQPGILYGGTGYPGSGQFLEIDHTTGSGTLIGQSGIIHPVFGYTGEITGLAINSIREIYCSVYRGPDIYRLDAASGGAVLAASTNLEIVAITFGPNDVLYARSYGSSDLYSIDITTGTVSNLGATNLFFDGMAFDPGTGLLWVSTRPDNIYTIDVSTLDRNLIGETGFGVYTGDLEFDQHGNLYGVNGTQQISDFMRISKFDGSGIIIGSTGFSSVYSMATLLETFWMVNAQNTIVNNNYQFPGTDTLLLNSKIANPDSHTLAVQAIIESFDHIILDTLQMFDDGAHNDSSAGDNIFGTSWPVLPGESFYEISINPFPLASGYLNNVSYNTAQFTTSGPVEFVSDSIIQRLGHILFTKITLKNIGLTATVPNISASLSSNDPRITSIGNNPQYFGDIDPGQNAISQSHFSLFTSNLSQIDSINLIVDIYSNGKFYWRDSTAQMIVGIKNTDQNIPKEFALKQNYPNPFNPSTNIEFALPKTAKVTLKVYNAIGQELTTLVSEELIPGKYKYTWDATGFASGIYYYKIEAGVYVKTKKLLLLK